VLEIRIRVVVVEVVERPGRSQLSGPFSGTGSDLILLHVPIKLSLFSGLVAGKKHSHILVKTHRHSFGLDRPPK
jgi:hypothetical protein